MKIILNQFLLALTFYSLLFSSLFIRPTIVLAQDANLDAQREACEKQSDKYWDTNLNACKTKKDVYEDRKKTEACADAADPDECYMKLAEDKSGVKRSDGKELDGVAKKSTYGSMIAGAYGLFLAATYFVARPAGRSTMCKSKMVFIATSVAWVIGDYFLKRSGKKYLEKLKKEYDEEAKNDEHKGGSTASYEAQVRAFQYLKQEQRKIRQNSKNRYLLHIAVGAGFTASLAMALFEMTTKKSGDGCGEDTTEKGDQTQTTDGSTDQAGTDQAGTDGNTAGETDVAEVKEPATPSVSEISWMKGFGTSPQLVLASGVMLGLNVMLAMASRKQAKDTEENEKKIDEVLAQFKEHIAGFCPDGRDDMNRERCYCYTAGGNKNENRTNSQICQKLWSNDNKNFALGATDYKGQDVGPPQGCLTIHGKFDMDCKCRKIKNKKTGENACYKTPVPQNANAGPGAALGVGATISNLNQFTQGANKAIAALNEDNLKKNAARNKKVLSSLVKQLQKSGFNPGEMLKAEQKAPKLAAIAQKSPTLTAFVKKNGGSFQSAGFSALSKGNPTLAKASNLIKKSSPTSTFTTSGKGISSHGRKSKGDGFKFAWNEDALKDGSKIQDIAAREKKFNYKDSDIVKRPDVSIWQVITNRYNQSGYERLFEAE
jgi:hypothetical protein